MAKRTVKLQIWLSIRELENLKKQAAKEDISRSEYVRMLIARDRETLSA